MDINTPISSLPSFKCLNPIVLNSIYKQIIQEENDSSSYQLKPFYITIHSTVRELHRAILIDWLVNVHLYLRLSDECFFLTVKVLDQYISQVECLHKDKLQLLGITALLISSKCIESKHPSIDELCLLCDNAYTKAQIVSFEKEILRKLDYVVVQDNIVNFFDIMCLFFDFTLKEYHFGKFLLEISILDLSLSIKYKKTLLVLSIVYLVMKMNIDKHQNYKKCFMFLKNRKVTEPQVKLCGKAVLVLLENVKKCSPERAARTSSNTQGFPIAPLPIIIPSQFVSLIIRSADAPSTTSPFPMTGIFTASFTLAMISLSDSPE